MSEPEAQASGPGPAPAPKSLAMHVPCAALATCKSEQHATIKCPTCEIVWYCSHECMRIHERNHRISGCIPPDNVREYLTAGVEEQAFAKFAVAHPLVARTIALHLGQDPHTHQWKRGVVPVQVNKPHETGMMIRDYVELVNRYGCNPDEALEKQIHEVARRIHANYKVEAIVPHDKVLEKYGDYELAEYVARYKPVDPEKLAEFPNHLSVVMRVKLFDPRYAEIVTKSVYFFNDRPTL